MITESVWSKEGLAGRAGQMSGNSQQIGFFVESTEHLPKTEGLDEVAVARTIDTRWKTDAIVQQASTPTGGDVGKSTYPAVRACGRCSARAA
jgi:hypothetical protein